MAIVQDTTGGASGVSTTTVNWLHNAAAGAMLVVTVGYQGSPSTVAVTFNGVSMTQLWNKRDDINIQGVAGFVMAAPASGSHSIVVTLGTSADLLAGGSVSYTGVVSTSDAATHRTVYTANELDTPGTTPTVTVVDSQSGDLVFNGVIDFTSTGITSGQTSVVEADPISGGSSAYGMGSASAVGGNTVMSWTGAGSFWAIGATSLIPSGGASGLPPGMSVFSTPSRLAPGRIDGAQPDGLIPVLVGKDKFFGAAGMGPNYDWPNPIVRAFPMECRTFADPSEYWLLKDTFFGVAGNPNRDQPNPRIAPFPVENRSFADPSEYWLLQDKFFGLAGNPNTDFPNPRGYTFPVEGRNFVNPMEPQLLGKDQFFGAPGERTIVDQPNPIIARQPRQDYIINLLETTLGVAPPKPFVQSDWVNPRGATPPSGIYTIAGRPVYITPIDVPFLPSDFQNPGVRRGQPDIYMITGGMTGGPTAVTQAPFRQVEWTNPLLRQFPIANRTLIVYYVLDDSAPFVQSDWPNPIGKAYGIDLRTFLNCVETQLIGQDQFFGAPGERTPVDQPNPIRASQVRGSYTSMISLLESTLGIAVPAPFSQDEWPNPLIKSPAITMRSWMESTKIHLIGQDQMFGDPGQVPQYAFPNPLTYRQQVDLRASMVNLLQNTLGIVVPAPFAMLDWPNPRGYVPATELKTFLNQVSLNLYGKDQFYGAPGQPPPNYDQPNPRGYTYPVVCRVFIGPINPNLYPVVVDSPFINYDQPNPRGYAYPVTNRTIAQSRTDLLGKDQFFGVGGPRYDYPNPIIARQPITLKVFVDPLKIHLLGKDQFFGAPGQPPPNRDQPNPLRYRQPIDLKSYFNNLMEGTLGIAARNFSVAYIADEYFLVTDITMDSYTLTGLEDDTDVESQ